MSDEFTKLVMADTAADALERRSAGRRFFSRRKSRRPPPIHCENCGGQLHGHWCAQCGQPAIDYRRSFGAVLFDVLNEFLNWDSKFFATIGLLIAKPWKLTNDFIAGHRVRYVHPLRLYLLASILFFFAATFGIKSAHFRPIDLSPNSRAEISDTLARENIESDVRQRIEQALGGKPISPEKRAALEEQLKNQALPKIARDAIQQRLQYGDPAADAHARLQDAMKDLTPDIRAKVEQSLRKKKDDVVAFEPDRNEKPNELGKWLEKRAREKFGDHGSKAQLFLVALMNNLPYMMLACVPLFAFVLKILYLRRRKLYIDHLIYALHIHSFAYVGIMLAVLSTIGLNRIIPGVFAGWLIAALWTAFGVQIFLSIRRVYRQGWFFTVFKFFLGGLVYLVVLSLALAMTFFVTLALPD